MTGQSTATLRYLRMSPRKVRLFINLIRGMRAEEALLQLRFSPKMASEPVAKLLASAMANATNNHGLVRESLVIENAFVNNGPIMYRWMPRAMGRATPIRKRTAHVTIVLAGDVEAGKAKHEEAKKAVDADGAESGSEQKKSGAKKASAKHTVSKKKPATKRVAAKKPMVRKAGRSK